MRTDVRVEYDFSNWPAMDAVIEQAVGRHSDYSGAGMGCRDHGWVCESDIEVARIARALKEIGLVPTLYTPPED